MTVVVTSKAELVVPKSIRRKAGIKTRDRLEFRVSGGVITILPKVSAAGEETPTQRRIIDGEIDKSLDELKDGRKVGPFDTAGEAIAAMKAELRKRAVAKKTTRPR